MNNIKDHENLNHKKVLLRLDLNVPLKNGIITDYTRIDKILPIIQFLLSKNSKIIIISHVGRPKGKVNKELSLKPICESLEKKIDKKIQILNENIFKLKRDDLFKKPEDQIVILENIRFYEEEEKNDTLFAKHLANLGESSLALKFLVKAVNILHRMWRQYITLLYEGIRVLSFLLRNPLKNQTIGIKLEVFLLGFRAIDN